MTPTMGDPRQAKMMLIMPVVSRSCFSACLGLVLYWTLSNVLQIAQQLYMERSGTPRQASARVMKKAWPGAEPATASVAAWRDPRPTRSSISSRPPCPVGQSRDADERNDFGR